ncbi:TPA: DUF2622 domain-containing protein [Citrobacter freundii]|uniref:DUF2622 domain-containing protein n=1 Tax=Citrobacter freundii complex TaxID=1344959 RepID=UPI001A19BC1C|nr:DUF2622 domain-containing protein [Citrobacter freundii]HAT4017114.1 DUF2622 domain-containing protein [Citrobacter freundii]HAT4021538.1 DUF2622 domain-containing protein [Citrobacter freundii]HAT4026653.1 DUF2622 domain-containing protein [Citrobacter freundii]HAT4036106.1 DUF2622 domain-containing protein [Citrobacter freundii]
MTRFTVRIELHGADDSHYEALHEAMAAKGFSKTVVGTSGTEYDLPGGEYSYTANETLDSVLQKAGSTADTIISNSVLVTQSAERKWLRLKPTTN